MLPFSDTYTGNQGKKEKKMTIESKEVRVRRGHPVGNF